MLQDRLRFEHLTVADGLPGNVVRSLVQDTAGFVWAGTASGVARYDGYTFETFP